MRVCVVLAAATMPLSGASAQAPGAVDVAPAPIVTRRDLVWLVVGSGVTILAQRADLDVRRQVRSAGTQDNGGLDALARVGNVWGQPLALLGGMGLWVGGRVGQRPTLAASGLRAVEAIGVSGVLGKVAKGAFGRARPRVNGTDAWDVDPGRGFSLSDGDYESLPSGHTTAAFAFAAAVTSEVRHRAPQHARWVGIASFSVAAATAYARVHDDAHWLSDVAAGATLGATTGWAVTRWHRTRPGNRVDRLLLGAGPEGAALIGVSLPWP